MRCDGALLWLDFNAFETEQQDTTSSALVHLYSVKTWYAEAFTKGNLCFLLLLTQHAVVFT